MPVIPRNYDSVTVAFCQIVDFSLLMAKCTPDQVIYFIYFIFIPFEFGPTNQNLIFMQTNLNETLFFKIAWILKVQYWTILKVISFLNDVFTRFDIIINRHDAYKVETTGETYMVASGVPNENQGRHIFEVAEIALEIRQVYFYFTMHSNLLKKWAAWTKRRTVAIPLIYKEAARIC